MDLFGSEALRLVVALVIVSALIVLGSWLVKRFAGGRIVTGVRGRQKRIYVVEATIVDARRKLVLVRRDNVEHLVLIGGPNDLVIEPAIGRQPAPPPARRAPAPGSVQAAGAGPGPQRDEPLPPVVAAPPPLQAPMPVPEAAVDPVRPTIAPPVGPPPVNKPQGRDFARPTPKELMPPGPLASQPQPEEPALGRGGPPPRQPESRPALRPIERPAPAPVPEPMRAPMPPAMPPAMPAAEPARTEAPRPDSGRKATAIAQDRILSEPEPDPSHPYVPPAAVKPQRAAEPVATQPILPAEADLAAAENASVKPPRPEPAASAPDTDTDPAFDDLALRLDEALRIDLQRPAPPPAPPRKREPLSWMRPSRGPAAQ
ncbi:flagellar biosynthetic protein FliO, partial [Methylobrevis pamukkalensis]|uniref:flagellar biosynthetic protein FliO n=1 Tax=Methylobrevis pamukkalensis TaxID=1439726 RepID=UPI000846232F